MDGVRIKYGNKQSVFFYGGIAKKDAVAKAREHLRTFTFEFQGETIEKGVPTGGEIRPVDHSQIVVEFVTNEGKESESVEPIPFTPNG